MTNILIKAYNSMLNAGQILGSLALNPLYTNSKIADFAGRSPFASVFGVQSTAQRENNITLSFKFGTGLEGVVDWLKFVKDSTGVTNATGTVTSANEVLFMESGTGIADYEYYSRDINRYIPGQQNDIFFTFKPEASEAGVDIGLGYGRKSSDFIGLGYNGLDFGIWIILRTVRTFIPRSEWTNQLSSGSFVLDLTKENICYIGFGWLGVADIIFAIQTSEGGWIEIYRHKTANIDDKPHMGEPTQPMSIWTERLSGAGTNVRMGTSSWFAGTLGKTANGTGQDKAPFIEYNDLPVTSSERPLINIYNVEQFNGKQNTVITQYGTLTLTSTGNREVSFRVYINGVDPTVGNWAFMDEIQSVTKVNFDSPLSVTTEQLLPSAGTFPPLTRRREQIGGTFLLENGITRINLFDSDVKIRALPGDVITITGYVSQGTSRVNVLLRPLEKH